MKLITYSIKDNKYYRNNEEVEPSILKEELGGDRFRKLRRNKEIRVQSSKITIKEIIKKDKPKKEKKVKKEPKPKKIKKNSDERLFEINKDLYKIDHTTYNKAGPKIELWRKNIRYGYYNFVAYLESDEDFKERVIQDIKDQAKKEKAKRNIITDDDI